MFRLRYSTYILKQKCPWMNPGHDPDKLQEQISVLLVARSFLLPHIAEWLAWCTSNHKGCFAYAQASHCKHFCC